MDKLHKIIKESAEKFNKWPAWKQDAGNALINSMFNDKRIGR